MSLSRTFPRRKRIEAVSKHSKVPLTMLAILYPKTVSALLELLGVETFGIVNKQFRGIISKVVREHEKTFREDETPRDFTDVYLKQRLRNQGDLLSSFHGREGERNGAAVLEDLVQAGTDTISTTVAWAVLYMARYPGE